MFPRLLESRNSLDSLDEHTTYTLVRLEADPSASELAPPFTELDTRTSALRVTERELTRAEIRAQARADHVAEESATLIAAFSLDLLKNVGGDRDDKRWSHLFSESPSVLARRGLERQIDVVRSWPAYLASEPSLAAWAEPFTRVVDEGTVAVSQRDLAASTRSHWRALEREALFRDANRLRETLYGQLCQRAVSAGKGRSWPAGFFKTVYVPKRQPEIVTVAPQ